MDYSDPACFTYPFQLTKTIHRDVYPYLDPSRAELSAKGKTVLITGAVGGLGEAIAEAWCIAKVSKILITGRNAQALEDMASRLQAISSSTEVVTHAGDITSEESVQALFAKGAKLGTLDVLLHTAGTLNMGNIADTPLSKWWIDFETNMKAFYLLTQEFYKQGGGKGTIVTIGTGATALTPPGMSSYVTSKLAQQKFIEFVHAEASDLRVFTLNPGIPLTKMTLPAYLPYAKDDTMLSAGWTLFLATPQADWLSGSTISVNWDPEEMEANKKAIQDGNLTSLGWLKAQLQKGGHPF